jgi:RNA polymerase sigma-54 factor
MAMMEMLREQRQTQTVSPRLQHAVRLLQMSSLDFSAMVRDSLSSNPFLEAEDADDHEGQLVVPMAALAPDAGNADVRPTEPADPGPPPEDDREIWIGASRAAPGGDDSAASALEAMPVQATLSAHLHSQLNVLPLMPRDMALAHALVDSLDEDGYLRSPLEELALTADLQPKASDEELQIALRRVQSLDPAGVCARSVAECLRLQLPAIPCPELRGLAMCIVDEHLAALAARDVAALCQRLDAPRARVEAACAAIRHLDPHPGWRHDSGQVAYVVPDVITKKVRGVWTVKLNPAVVPRVRLNQLYAALFRRHRRKDNEQLAEQLQEARWTLQNVEQRFSTILDVAEAIVARQHHFLDYGPMAMKPLGLREIADAVGVHESTVSRVTNNKYMATPTGVFELKHFFSRAMVSASGRECSGTAIRGLIEEMILAEPARAPLSDAEIARQLAQQGLVVARRTVTKYRQTLRIEPVEMRRRRHAMAQADLSAR